MGQSPGGLAGLELGGHSEPQHAFGCLGCPAGALLRYFAGFRRSHFLQDIRTNRRIGPGPERMGSVSTIEVSTLGLRTGRIGDGPQHHGVLRSVLGLGRVAPRLGDEPVGSRRSGESLHPQLDRESGTGRPGRRHGRDGRVRCGRRFQHVHRGICVPVRDGNGRTDSPDADPRLRHGGHHGGLRCVDRRTNDKRSDRDADQRRRRYGAGRDHERTTLG